MNSLVAPLDRRQRVRLAGLMVCLVLASCSLPFPARLPLPAQVVDPSVVGIITENESVPGDDDQVVTVNGQQLRVRDPGLRAVQGPGLGVDRLLIYWETDTGPYFVVAIQSTASNCYNLTSAAAYDTGQDIVFVWSDQPGLGVRLPKAPGYEPRLDDEESRALILSIKECLNADGVVIDRE